MTTHSGGTELEIGGGQGDTSPEFVPLQDGGDALLQVGSQGGFHVFLNLRWMSDAPPPASIVIERQARRENTGDLVSTATNQVTMVRAAGSGDYETSQSMRMFLCPTPVGISVQDEVLSVVVRGFVDEQQTKPIAEGNIRLVPRCPTDDHAALCARICSG
jgi:hypothetical protein